MKPALSLRVRVTLCSVAVLFLLALNLTATALIAADREHALADAQRRTSEFVRGAESTLNRNLLGVDILLASLDEMLQLSGLVLEWIDIPQSTRLMRAGASQNLLVGYVALLTPQGGMVVSSDSNDQRSALVLPLGFLEDVLAQPVPTLVVSAPAVGYFSAEPVLYMARTVKLADASHLIALAEVRVPLLNTIMALGVNTRDIEITLERTDGQLLTSVPPDDPLTGTQLTPTLQDLMAGAEVRRAPSRLTGTPAIMVAHSTLYSNLSIVASVPLASALATWSEKRNAVVIVMSILSLIIVAATAAAWRYLGRLSQARRQILDGKAQIEATLDAMPDSLLELDLDGRYHNSHAPHPALLALAPGLFENGRVADHLPADAAQVIDQALQQAYAHGHSKGKQFALTHAATPIWFELSVARKTGDGNDTPRFIVIARDITAGKVAAQEIEQLAFYDPLTLLPNRRLLMDRLQQARASSARSARWGALMFMDLDHFKTVNDSLGHDIGDSLLQQVALRLRACVREADTVARFGGDEFVVMLEHLETHTTEAATQTELIGEKMLAELNLPYRLGKHTLTSTPSIGATLFNGHEQPIDELFKQADIAMYQAKTSGRNRIRFFDPQMQATITARTSLEHDLRAALDQRQFELHYQAQVTQDGRVVGAEVLIRWSHPVRGMVPPMDFIALTEETGLILPIGQWVLQTACEQLKAWEGEPLLGALELAVNVSARQFRGDAFVAEVASVLQQTAANPARLKLELTESLVLDDVDDTVAKMNQLKAIGVRFSMDDFGTGQSSLSYLTMLPLDQLKIDQSFVRNIGVKTSDTVIIQTIIGLASKLDMEVIAEGVETAAQRDFLHQNGCAVCQGYLFGRPVALEVFERQLRPS